MNRLCAALLDPIFDEQQDERWFAKADSQAAEFCDTLELWLDLAEGLRERFFDWGEDGDGFEVPTKFVRITRITQWLLGDRSAKRNFDSSPISELLRVFTDFEAWIDFEADLQADAKERGEAREDVDLSVFDEFPMSDFDLSRVVDRAKLVVARALSSQIKGYELQKRWRTKGLSASPPEWANSSANPGESDNAAFVANGFDVQQQRRDDEPVGQEDGPADVYTWRWEGQLVEVEKADRLKPTQWRLASKAWNCMSAPKCRIALSELTRAGGMFDGLQDKTVQKHASNVSLWFKANGIPLKVSTGDRHVWMERIEPNAESS